MNNLEFSVPCLFGLEGLAGDSHLDEYADASTERGKCMLKRICD